MVTHGLNLPRHGSAKAHCTALFFKTGAMYDNDPICSSASPKRARDLRQSMTAPFIEFARKGKKGDRYFLTSQGHGQAKGSPGSVVD